MLPCIFFCISSCIFVSYLCNFYHHFIVATAFCQLAIKRICYVMFYQHLLANKDFQYLHVEWNNVFFHIRYGPSVWARIISDSLQLTDACYPSTCTRRHDVSWRCDDGVQFHCSVAHLDSIALLDFCCERRRLTHFSLREEIAVVTAIAAASQPRVHQVCSRRRRPSPLHTSRGLLAGVPATGALTSCHCIGL